MKRLLLWLSALVLLGIPLALGTAVYLSFQDQPLVRRAVEVKPEDVERAVRLLEKHDPRRMKNGTLRTLSMRGEELDLVVNYLASRYGKASSRVELLPGVLKLAASVEVPGSPFGRYVNVQATLRETAALPAFEQLRIGRLPVPGWVGDWALARALRTLNGTAERQIAADTIRSVSIADGSVRMVYEWRDDLPARLSNVMLPPEDRERLRIYQERLVQFTRDKATPRSVSLADLMTPLLRLASERGASGDAQAESRAVTAVVAFYVNGKGLAAIVPGAKDWPRASPHTVTLKGRTDSPQHFTVSAALAAHAGGPLSDAIGLYREVDDSRRGSGFSFADIAADRAGTVFGEIATRSPDSARRLQRRVAACPLYR